MKKLFYFLCIFIGSKTFAQIFPVAPSMWANSELNHQFGTNTTTGQAPIFFPKNVFGPPPSSASPGNPSYMQSDIVSLGRNGFVSLGFFPTIENRPGYDLIVFENVLRLSANNDFGEWMIVQASIDGVNWKTFPFDSISGEGLAGKKVTYNGPNQKDTSSIGGDAFDLDLVGLDSAKYIRVIDATIFQERKGCSGCASTELDAIAAVHQVGDAVGVKNYRSNSIKIFSNQNQIIINQLENKIIQIEIFDLMGRKIYQNKTIERSFYIDKNELSASVNIVTISDEEGKITVKKIIF